MHSSLSRRGEIPTSLYADIAAGYTWGPGKTIEIEQSWRAGTSNKLQGCVGHGWARARKLAHGLRFLDAHEELSLDVKATDL